MESRPKTWSKLLEQRERADDEAGSVVLHAGHDRNKNEKNDEETDDAAAAEKMLGSNEVISKEDMEIRRFIEWGEEPHPKKGSNDWKKWASKLENASGTKKEWKDRQRFKEKSSRHDKELPMSLENFKASCMMKINMMKQMESDGNETENDGKELIEIPEITQQMNYRKQSKDSRMAKQRKARESERKT